MIQKTISYNRSEQLSELSRVNFMELQIRMFTSERCESKSVKSTFPNIEDKIMKTNDERNSKKTNDIIKKYDQRAIKKHSDCQ